MSLGKKYRRKESACILCGGMTRDWNYVCGGCRTDQETGANLRKRLEEAKETEEKVIRVAWYWNYYPWVKDARSKDPINRETDRWEVEKKLTADLITLSEIQKMAGYTTEGRLVGVWPDRKHESLDCYLAKKDTEELLCRIIQHIRNLVWYYEQKGYSEGKHFVHKLASGELSMKDLQDEEIEER